MSHRTQDDARAATERIATRAAITISILILAVSFLVAACGGSGTSSPQGTTVVGQPGNSTKD